MITVAIGLVVGGLLVLTTTAMSVRAGRTLPPDARVPTRYFFGRYGRYRPKTTALVTWPAVSIFIYCLQIVVCAEIVATHDRGPGSASEVFIMPIVIAGLIGQQRRAIRRARRAYGSDGTP